MVRRTAVALFTLAVSVASVPVYAADADVASPATDAADSIVLSTPPLMATARPPMSPAGANLPAARPGALPMLYASLAALHAYDAYSTLHGVATGAQEANGLMRGAAASPIAMVGVKAAVSALPIVLAEHMWKTNRTAAIVLMVVSNGMMAAVAANNAHVLHQLR